MMKNCEKRYNDKHQLQNNTKTYVSFWVIQLETLTCIFIYIHGPSLQLKNNIIKSVKIFFTSKVKINQRNIMQISLNTVTSLMPEIDAPKQRPVDIAPHPEYKSSKVHSGLLHSLIWLDFSLTAFLSAARTLDPDSLESVEVSLSILGGAVSIRVNHNQHKKSSAKLHARNLSKSS